MTASFGPPTGDAELRALTEVLNRTYLRSEEEGAGWLKRVPTDELRVVRTDGRVAGGLLLYAFGQWFGGRRVPMRGVAAVGIDPEHRAKGLASELVVGVLEETHGDGYPLSALFPATQPVYRRAGYELAGHWLRYRLAADVIDLRDRDLDLRRLEAPDPELLKGLYEARARTTNGNLDRTDDFWERIWAVPNEDVHLYVVGPDAAPEGYVAFTQNREAGWKYDLRCRDLVALTPAAGRRLLTFFADHRSFANDVVWNGAPADPMAFHLREQDWSIAQSWRWMLRVVDVRGALDARGYPSGLETAVHLQVADDVLPWNDGRFVLEVSGGAGRARKGGRGRVRIDVRGLAALYSGFASAEALRQAGLADGREDDLAAASAAFGGPAPWCADFF